VLGTVSGAYWYTLKPLCECYIAESRLHYKKIYIYAIFSTRITQTAAAAEANAKYLDRKMKRERKGPEPKSFSLYFALVCVCVCASDGKRSGAPAKLSSSQVHDEERRFT